MTGPLRDAVEARLDALAAGRVVERIFERDHTVWREDPAEIDDRLGWLDVADAMRPRAAELAEFARGVAADGITSVVLLGMGGSSLAAETITRVLGVAEGMPSFTVLDSTHPSAVTRIEREHDMRRTLFVVASKSGGTVETLSHLQYFYARIRRGAQFAAITDPGSSLESLAAAHDFRGVFLNPPDIGGRFSALSLFGLVPAALAGADLDAMLSGAQEMTQRCRSAAPDNPAALLGAALGEAALAGRDKATLAFAAPQTALGAWSEQLFAESTGKEGRGILPVVDEPAGPPGAFGDDRIFARWANHEWIDETGAPVVNVEPAEGSPAARLGAEFFRLELATAVAGHVLGIHPFDQPNVAQAKEATAKILERGGAGEPLFEDPQTVLEPAPEYLALLAFVDPTPENHERLQRARVALRDRLAIAVTAAFGPRYLHSTGQLHKGGAGGGGFLIVRDAGRETDAPIPGRGFGFGTLIDAQAAGDAASLRDAGRRVATVRMRDVDALA